MAASSALPPSARGTRLVTVMPTMLPGRADVRVVREWLKLLTYGIAEVTGLAGAGALVQGTTTGPGMDEERDGTAQGGDVPREVPSWA
jgi:hypothetical protein